MDKFETLATEAELAVAIIGDADGSEVELLPVTHNPLDPDKLYALAAQWAAQGLHYHFVGSIGIVDGKIRVALLSR